MQMAEANSLRWLVIAASVGLVWVLLPFSGALLWAVVFAILFHPLHTRLLGRMPGRDTLAAATTMLIAVAVMILPLMLVTWIFLDRVNLLYRSILTGSMNPSLYLERLYTASPQWLVELLDRLGSGDLTQIKARAYSTALRAGQIVASFMFSTGQSVLIFVMNLLVMLYLLFFFLRDGMQITRAIADAVPLQPHRVGMLFTRFTTVVRATIKSNLLIALLQGSLGATIFLLLGLPSPFMWGAVMGVLSLLPLVGAILVWLPTALYLMASGSVARGTILIAWGLLAIGLVDNVVRPRVVGKDAHIPDYLVLISGLGGISLFGISGFIIGPLAAALFVTAWGIFADATRSIEDIAESGSRPGARTPDSTLAASAGDCNAVRR